MSGDIRIGIGGWTFEPWRGVFYPPGLTQAKELDYASRKLTSIEINGHLLRQPVARDLSQMAGLDARRVRVFSEGFPASPPNRKVLAEAGESIARFVQSGVLELEDRLGPLPVAVRAHQGL